MRTGASMTPTDYSIGKALGSPVRGFVDFVRLAFALPENRALHEAPLRHPSGEIATHVIPASVPTDKEGLTRIHFDFSRGGVATTLLLRGMRMRNQRIRLSLLCSIRLLTAREQKRRNEEAKRQRRKWIPAQGRNDGQNPKPDGGAGSDGQFRIGVEEEEVVLAHAHPGLIAHVDSKSGGRARHDGEVLESEFQHLIRPVRLQ